MPSKTSKSSPKPKPKSRSLWKAAPGSSETDLERLAAELARLLTPGSRVFLEGPLGAGKTTFARALLRSLGVVQPPEGSPTFAIAHEYQSARGDVVHVDLYRLESEDEIEAAGIEAYFWERQLIAVCEWASRFPAFFEAAKRPPNPVFHVTLAFNEGGDPAKRDVEIRRENG